MKSLRGFAFCEEAVAACQLTQSRHSLTLEAGNWGSPKTMSRPTPSEKSRTASDLQREIHALSPTPRDACQVQNGATSKRKDCEERDEAAAIAPRVPRCIAVTRQGVSPVTQVPYRQATRRASERSLVASRPDYQQFFEIIVRLLCSSSAVVMRVQR